MLYAPSLRSLSHFRVRAVYVYVVLHAMFNFTVAKLGLWSNVIFEDETIKFLIVEPQIW